jgi:hypothetical protein
MKFTQTLHKPSIRSHERPFLACLRWLCEFAFSKAFSISGGRCVRVTRLDLVEAMNFGPPFAMRVRVGGVPEVPEAPKCQRGVRSRLGHPPSSPSPFTIRLEMIEIRGCAADFA